MKSTVREAIAAVRGTAQRGELFYIYAVEGSGRLRGVVSLRNLMIARDHETIASILSPEVVSLREGTSAEEACRIFSRSRFLSLPVINDEERLVGVLHAHSLLDEHVKEMDALFEERTRGELFELLGIKADEATHHPLQIAAGRLPWLFINILGGIAAAFFIHSLGSGLSRAVEFLAFVPILLIISESVGMQTASIVIADLHRFSSRRPLSRGFFRQGNVACLIGIACALLVSLGIFLWKGTFDIALAVGLTVVISVPFVYGLANMIPYLFHKLHVDPRLASGPVILAIADCSTLLLYLGLAIWITR